MALPHSRRRWTQRDETEGDYMAAVSGVRCAQGIARPFCPLRSTLTPDTAAKALASRFNRAPPVAARPETKTMNERPNMFAQNDVPLSVHSRTELPDDQLRVLAPSVFAAQAMPGVSSRYAFVPTAHLVARLRDAGWAPVSAVEQRIKVEDRRGFQKHLIRFQRHDVVPVKGEYTPELCLINSHDRSSAYQLHAGLFRFICANGMFVGHGNAFERVSIRHAGFTPEEVIDASFRILDQVPAHHRQRRSVSGASAHGCAVDVQER